MCPRTPTVARPKTGAPKQPNPTPVHGNMSTETGLLHTLLVVALPELCGRLTRRGCPRTFISPYGESWKALMREFMNITKALADETRVRTLLALRKGELCVCQITELFGLAPSTISKHLSILFQARLVESRKKGRWIYYQLPGKSAPAAVREALDWIEKSQANDPQMLADNKQLKKILKLDPVELCKRQCKK